MKGLILLFFLTIYRAVTLLHLNPAHVSFIYVILCLSWILTITSRCHCYSLFNKGMKKKKCNGQYEGPNHEMYYVPIRQGHK